jgi:amidohydrolase
MRKTDLSLAEETQRSGPSMVALRRDLHRHPELSFEERRTAQIIAEHLQAAELEVRTGVAGTGVVGILRGGRPGRTIAWRADIDALPLTEPGNAPYISATPGVMHACGHDGHTAIGVALAQILSTRRADLPGTAVFIFQPAEEILGGARPMIDAGVLEDPYVEEIYGLHLTTQLPTGKVQVRAGALLSAASAFAIEVRGRGGHGAYPHLAVDPITAAAHILIGMQHLVTKEVPAQEMALITIGQMQAGTKNNIIPENAVMRGTLRTFGDDLHLKILERLGAFATDMARTFRAEAELTLDPMSCPAVVNHAKQTAFVRCCTLPELGADAIVEGSPAMASDDMCHFLRARPGCYFRVGVAPAHGRPAPHHAPQFEMNEDGLAVGLRAALSVMLGALSGASSPPVT